MRSEDSERIDNLMALTGYLSSKVDDEEESELTGRQWRMAHPELTDIFVTCMMKAGLQVSLLQTPQDYFDLVIVEFITEADRRGHRKTSIARFVRTLKDEEESD